MLSRKKATIWSTIANEFNAEVPGDVHRNGDALLTKYRNLKKRTKKKFADEKVQVLGTGGGEHTKINFTDTEEEMKQILGMQMTGHTAIYDDDLGQPYLYF